MSAHAHHARLKEVERTLGEVQENIRRKEKERKNLPTDCPNFVWVAEQDPRHKYDFRVGEPWSRCSDLRHRHEFCARTRAMLDRWQKFEDELYELRTRERALIEEYKYLDSALRIAELRTRLETAQQANNALVEEWLAVPADGSAPSHSTFRPCPEEFRLQLMSLLPPEAGTAGEATTTVSV